MPQYLTVVDTTGIQPYIFNSNRMRENIGASCLVAEATREWALEALPEPNNVHYPPGGGNPTLSPCADDLKACVVQAAGGNVIVRFPSLDDSRVFVRGLSSRALECAPGLRLIVTTISFETDERFDDVLQRAFCEMDERKQAADHDRPLLGVGPTVMCQSTGFPTTGVVESAGADDPGYPASSDIRAKSRAGQPRDGAADKRLARSLDLSSGDCPFLYPSEFKDLGGSEHEANYIAVVHADGNGMGDRIQAVTKDAKDDEDAAEKLRAFSEELASMSRLALQTVVDRLAASVISDPKEKAGKVVRHPAHSNVPPVSLCRDKADGSHGFYLPMRPLVFGGDDVTFVCDGRLGIDLAVAYLEAFEDATQDLPDGKGRATACAGVAIVAAHYPFGQAYALASELCDSAKTYHRALCERPDAEESSAIDWHFTTGGLYGSLAMIRQREYRFDGDDHSLTMRPLALNEPVADEYGRSWKRFRKAVDMFQAEKWQSQRNKLKALLETMSRSPDPAEINAFRVQYLGAGQLPDLELPHGAQYRENAWVVDDSVDEAPSRRNAYFDAAEAADWFIPLVETEARDAT